MLSQCSGMDNTGELTIEFLTSSVFWGILWESGTKLHRIHMKWEISLDIIFVPSYVPNFLHFKTSKIVDSFKYILEFTKVQFFTKINKIITKNYTLLTKEHISEEIDNLYYNRKDVILWKQTKTLIQTLQLSKQVFYHTTKEKNEAVYTIIANKSEVININHDNHTYYVSKKSGEMSIAKWSKAEEYMNKARIV